MIEYILFALWFFWPAGLGNAAPVFAAKIPLLHKFGIPIDGGKTFAGKRLLGDHKTWRGLAAGMVMSTLIVLLQVTLYNNFAFFKEVSMQVDYSSTWILVLGPLFGFGALFGDGVKSFFKRQMGVPSGKSWFPFDQIDYIIGGLLFSSIVVVLTWQQYLAIILVWFLLHPAATFVAWLLHLKDSPI